MPDPKFLYSFRYDPTESKLCKLESKSVFGTQEKNKILLSEHKVDPSISAYIKFRLDIISLASDFQQLVKQIKEKNIQTDGFKIEYLGLPNDSTKNTERLSKLKDVGFSINTFPDFENPSVIYSICTYEGHWYFGIAHKNSYGWEKHKQKPVSYSNSIKQNIAKSLVNIAVESSQNFNILNACCGVGTIMLEACYAGHKIEGCDINEKACKNARINLSHFNYTTEVHCLDVKDITQKYDVVIIDLPYNLYSPATDEDIRTIISATTRITKRMIIVSSKDVRKVIEEEEFRVLDYCEISKRGKSNFTRRVWVCEK